MKKAPFEVSETGWGEFEASIRIYFKDSDERPLDLFHLIKLYPPGPPQLSGSLKKVSMKVLLFWQSFVEVIVVLFLIIYCACL